MVARRNHTPTAFEELVIRALWIIIKELVLKQKVEPTLIGQWRRAAVETGEEDRGPQAQERWEERLS